MQVLVSRPGMRPHRPFPQACSNWMISTAGAPVTWDLLELQN